MSGSFDWANGAISVAYPLPVPASTELARFASATGVEGKGHYDLFRERLEAVAHSLFEDFGIGRYFVSVDGAGVIDRAVALAAGLGWRGKSTNVLTKAHGSWVMLGTIITELVPDASIVRKPIDSRCGSCVACVQACPTGALGEAYRCDASNCLSLVTQSAAPIRAGHAAKIGPIIYGCDMCQEVCPVNKRALSSDEPTPPTGQPAASDGNAALYQAIAIASDEELRAAYPQLYFPSNNIGLLRRNALIALDNLAI